jgi:hypothetical protein
MATGIGKTYTAFQIIWRLWKSRAIRRHYCKSRIAHTQVTMNRVALPAFTQAQ